MLAAGGLPSADVAEAAPAGQGTVRGWVSSVVSAWSNMGRAAAVGPTGKDVPKDFDVSGWCGVVEGGVRWCAARRLITAVSVSAAAAAGTAWCSSISLLAVVAGLQSWAASLCCSTAIGWEHTLCK